VCVPKQGILVRTWGLAPPPRPLVRTCPLSPPRPQVAARVDAIAAAHAAAADAEITALHAAGGDARLNEEARVRVLEAAAAKDAETQAAAEVSADAAARLGEMAAMVSQLQAATAAARGLRGLKVAVRRLWSILGVPQQATHIFMADAIRLAPYSPAFCAHLTEVFRALRAGDLPEGAPAYESQVWSGEDSMDAAAVDAAWQYDVPLLPLRPPPHSSGQLQFLEPADTPERHHPPPPPLPPAASVDAASLAAAAQPGGSDRLGTFNVRRMLQRPQSPPPQPARRVSAAVAPSSSAKTQPHRYAAIYAHAAKHDYGSASPVGLSRIRKQQRAASAAEAAVQASVDAAVARQQRALAAVAAAEEAAAAAAAAHLLPSSIGVAGGQQGHSRGPRNWGPHDHARHGQVQVRGQSQPRGSRQSLTEELMLLDADDRALAAAMRGSSGVGSSAAAAGVIRPTTLGGGDAAAAGVPLRGPYGSAPGLLLLAPRQGLTPAPPHQPRQQPALPPDASPSPPRELVVRHALAELQAGRPRQLDQVAEEGEGGGEEGEGGGGEGGTGLRRQAELTYKPPPTAADASAASARSAAADPYRFIDLPVAHAAAAAAAAAGSPGATPMGTPRGSAWLTGHNAEAAAAAAAQANGLYTAEVAALAYEQQLADRGVEGDRAQRPPTVSLRGSGFSPLQLSSSSSAPATPRDRPLTAARSSSPPTSRAVPVAVPGSAIDRSRAPVPVLPPASPAVREAANYQQRSPLQREIAAAVAGLPLSSRQQQQQAPLRQLTPLESLLQQQQGGGGPPGPSLPLQELYADQSELAQALARLGGGGAGSGAAAAAAAARQPYRAPDEEDGGYGQRVVAAAAAAATPGGSGSSGADDASYTVAGHRLPIAPPPPPSMGLPVPHVAFGHGGAGAAAAAAGGRATGGSSGAHLQPLSWAPTPPPQPRGGQRRY
jgi:hypothetical protein